MKVCILLFVQLVILALISFAEAGCEKCDVSIDGLVAAVFTPFTKTSEVDSSKIESQAAYLNATGVKWAFVSGTTGESVKLTMPERADLIAKWCEVAPRYGIQIIAHVGDESIEAAKALAKHAAAHGAHAIAAMPTVFFKPANVDALALSIQAIASAAPSLPFFYYHIPSMTGVSYPDGLLPLVEKLDNMGLDNFAGIKYTGLYTYPGFMDAERIMRFSGDKGKKVLGFERPRRNDDPGVGGRHHWIRGVAVQLW